MPPASFRGTAGGAACGDLVRIDLALARRARRGRRLRGVGLRRRRRGGLRGGRARARRAACSPPRGSARARSRRSWAGSRRASCTPRSWRPTRCTWRSAPPSRPPGALAPAPERTLVAMSGGVDSAVAALLVAGAGARGGRGDARALARRAQRRRGLVLLRARRPARALRRAPDGPRAPHARPARRVRPGRRRAVRRRPRGRAARPNPCVRCNGDVRLDAMLAFADRLGAADLATGHYARISDDGLLRAAADPAKDQSYMLAGLAPASVARMRFPLGGAAQAGGARARPRRRAARGRQARVAGPLLPRRHGQARVPRAPRRAARPARPDRRPAGRGAWASTTASTCSPSASARGSGWRGRSPRSWSARTRRPTRS